MGGNWQRAGKRSAPKPKPLPRPRSTPAQRAASTVSDNEVGARIHDFMERRRRELEAEGGDT